MLCRFLRGTSDHYYNEGGRSYLWLRFLWTVSAAERLYNTSGILWSTFSFDSSQEAVSCYCNYFHGCVFVIRDTGVGDLDVFCYRRPLHLMYCIGYDYIHADFCFVWFKRGASD